MMTATIRGRGAWAGALVLLVSLGLGTAASATTVLKVDVPEMTRTSEWVVRAHVINVSNVDLRSKGEGLYTDVTFVIDETYRGVGVPASYVMRMMGGVGTDGMALTIPGMPRFTPGEEVVVFLEKTSVGHVPCGLGQGVWRVIRPLVGPAFVRQSAEGLNLMARGADGALAPATVPGGARTLERLAADIAAVPVVAPGTTPGPLAPSAPTHE